MVVYHTLVNGTFDLENGLLPGGFDLPEALFQAANVTVSFERGDCEHVPATEPLKRFFHLGYGYLCFQDLRRPDNLFVLCLSGQTKNSFYHCTSPTAWKLIGNAHDSTTLRELFVGPGMNVFLAHQHPQPGLLNHLQTLPHFRDSVVVKLNLCPHLASKGDDDRFVYIVKDGIYDGIIQSLAGAEAWHSIERAPLATKSSSTFQCPQASTTVRVSCNHAGCLVSAHALLAANVEGDVSSTLNTVQAAERALSRLENGADLTQSNKNLLVRLLEVYYRSEEAEFPPSLKMDSAGAKIVAIAAKTLWGNKRPAGMMKASEAGVDGVVGDVPVCKIEMVPGESVQTFGQRVSRQLWCGGEKKTTFDDRNQQGGPFGILGQMPGSGLEIAVIMTCDGRQKECKKPWLAYRLRNTKKKGFTLYKRQDLAYLNCAILGFHLPEVCLTVFRVHQKPTDDVRWLDTLDKIQTLMKRSPVIYSAVPNDQPEEPDDEPLIPEKLSMAAFVKKWPLIGVNLCHLFDFGAKRIQVKKRQEYVKAFMQHGLGHEIPGTPSLHLVAFVNCRLQQFLHPSIIASLNALSEEVRISGGPWGDFPMVIEPWYDGHAYNDTLDMKEWPVKVPTEEQWKGWTVYQRLELAARLLGFHVFYVNWVRTNGTTPPLSDYHAVMEHIKPRLTLLKSTKFTVCENVINAKRQTRSFNEKTQDPIIFRNIIATLVGMGEMDKHVIEQSSRKVRVNPNPSLNDMEQPVVKKLSGAIQDMSQSISTIVILLSYMYQSYTLFPLLDVQRNLEDLRRELEMILRGLRLSGHTASGKSTFLSAMLYLLAAPAATVVHADLPNDNQKFLAFCNSMNPDTPDLTLDNLNDFIKDFGKTAQDKAAADDAKNVDVLFGPPHENKSTVSLTSAIRLLPQGNKGTTTSHVATRILNNNSLPWYIIRLHLRSWLEMEKLAEISPAYRRWMRDNTELVQEVAGKVLTLHVPGDCNTEAERRGRVEAFLNVLHGVFHADIHAKLGSKTCRITYPGAIRLIEIARPTNLIFPAFQDSIGGGEIDETLSNPDSKFKLSTILLVHMDEIFKANVKRELQDGKQVLVVYNHSKANNADKEGLKPPNYLAQEPSSVDSVVANVEEEFQKFMSTQLQVVAFDSVSAAAWIKYFKQGLVKAEQLRGLAMSIQASGMGKFLYAMHDLHVRAVSDLVEIDLRLRRSLDKLDKWQFGSFPSTRPSFVNDLRGLPAKDMVGAGFALASKGDPRKFSSSSLPQLDPVPQTTKKSLKYLAACSDLLEGYKGLLGTTLERCAAINLDSFPFNLKIRGGHVLPLQKIVHVIEVLEDQAQFTGSDVEEYAKVKEECNAVYQDLTKELVGYFCVTYDHIPRHLKSVAVEAAVLFLRTSCRCLKESVVVLCVSPPTEDDGDLSMTEALNRQVEVRSVSVGGQELQGVELTNHKTQFLEMGKYVMYRVVEQMFKSTLKVKTFREPTNELVKESLLYFLRGERVTVARTLKKMRNLEDVGQLVELLREHLVNSFENFTMNATSVCLEDAHPGFYVTRSDGAERTEELDQITSAMQDQATPILKQMRIFVEEAVYPTALLDQFLEMCRAIMSVDKEGLRCNGHAPFTGIYLGEDKDLEAPTTWIESLKTIVNSTPLATVDLDGLGSCIQDIEKRLGLHVKWPPEGFSTIRKATAYMLGIQCDDLMSEEKFAGIVQDKKLKDEKMRPFRQDFLEAKEEEGEVAKALDRVYAEYVAKNSLDLGALVKAMGMSIAYLLPTDWAYLFPGDCHMPLRYQGLGDAVLQARKNNLPPPIPLRPQSCMTVADLQLKTKDELAVPDDLYNHLQGGSVPTSVPTLKDVRNRLQTYTPTGEDLFYCIFFELIMVSITTKRAIAVVIYEDNEKVHEHIIRPHLKLQASEICKDKLQCGAGVYKDMVAEGMHEKWPKDTPEELEVIIVHKGYFFVCEGSFVGKGRPLGKKHPRGWSVEKEGGDGKKAREESEFESDLPYSSPNDLGLFMDEFTAMLNGDM